MIFQRVRRALLGLLPLLSAALPAAIPDAARQDPRFNLGYLVVTACPGVRSDGSGDATAGIQQAIDDAMAHRLTVMFPAGEYVISDTLRCFNWQLWSAVKAETAENPKKATTRDGVGHHILFGEEKDGRRPLIRLASDARGFDDPEKFKRPCGRKVCSRLDVLSSHRRKR